MIRFSVLLAAAWLLAVSAASAHHFKGLPHYNYFENYPQVPEEEFIGEVGDYEVILTVEDGGLGSLCSTYTGEDPLEKLADLLPKEAVVVRE